MKSRRIKTMTESKLITSTIETVGLKITQGAGVPPLYVFAIDGKAICSQIGVKRMDWHGGKFKPEGFQRQLDSKRVNEISLYLNNNRILPNALVVAFKDGVLSFSPSPGLDKDPIQVGKIVLQTKFVQDHQDNGGIRPVSEEHRIGYVIDGQHRMKAIEASTIEAGTFPVVLAAFCGVDAVFQLSQFYALNQTIPISASLLALLRNMLNLSLPPKQAHKQAISHVRELLQNKQDSPFEPGRYMKVSKILRGGTIDITVVERMINRAIAATNLKYRWNDDTSQIPDKDFDYIAQSLYVFWRAVQLTFPGYWGKKTKDQRLFCAIGLYTIVGFFNKVMQEIDPLSASAIEEARKRLEPLADLRWDKMENLPSVPKGMYPDALFTGLNKILDHGTARPYHFRVIDPATKYAFVDQTLK